jgi:hypothetical protein
MRASLPNYESTIVCRVTQKDAGTNPGKSDRNSRLVAVWKDPAVAQPSGFGIMTRHFKKAGFCVALLGMAILATAGAYDMRTFRSSPEASDATHSIMQESHGVRRFKTPEQQKVFVSLNIVGAATFAVGATLLILHNRTNKRDD